MPTTDERREVAARLRELADTGAYASKETMPLVGALLFVTNIDATRGAAEDIMRGLADLIEPEPERTCRMEIDWDYDGGCPAYYRDYVCSECKEDFIYYKNSRVSYCPNCGAKVVGE